MNDSQERAEFSKEGTLAIHGGQPAFPNGPPEWPFPDESIRESLAAIYESGNWGKYHGDAQSRVTELIANMVQQAHVRLCSSGTIAVELALRGVGVKPGDEVIVAGYDFPGNFRCIEACGAMPVVVDIDPATCAIQPDQLPIAHSPKTRAVIVSHLHGGLASMRAICDWGREQGVAIVEDACQAPGAIVEGQPAGSWGDASVLSFGGSKLLTAGRGGAVATNRSDILQRIRIFADRGNDAFPFSELQAAVLPCQFESLAQQNATRRQNAALLRKQFADHTILRAIDVGHADNHQPGYYKYSFVLNEEEIDAANRAAWIGAIKAEGIACDSGFRGFSKRGAKRCRKIGDLSASKTMSESGVILHHPILLSDQTTVQLVAQRLDQVTKAIANREA